MLDFLRQGPTFTSKRAFARVNGAAMEKSRRASRRGDSKRSISENKLILQLEFK